MVQLPLSPEVGARLVALAIGRLRSSGGPGSGNFGHAGRPGEIGGSGGGSGVEHHRPKTARALRDHESTNRYHDVEHAAVIDRSGQVIYNLTSGATNFIKIDEAIAPSLKDTVFTHNHPLSSGLSLEDGFAAIQFNMREMRAVGRDGTVHIIRRTGDTWPENFQRTLLETDIKVRDWFTRRILLKDMTIAEANAQHHDEVYAKAAQAVDGVRFERAEAYKDTELEQKLRAARG